MWHRIEFVAESRCVNRSDLETFARKHEHKYGILITKQGADNKELVEVNTWHVDALVADFKAQLSTETTTALRDEILATLKKLNDCTYSNDGRAKMNAIRKELITQITNLDNDRAAAKKRMWELGQQVDELSEQIRKVSNNQDN